MFTGDPYWQKSQPVAPLPAISLKSAMISVGLGEPQGVESGRIATILMCFGLAGGIYLGSSTSWPVACSPNQTAHSKSLEENHLG